MRNPQSSRIKSLLAISLLGRLRSRLNLLLEGQPPRRSDATATTSTPRPLLPIDAAKRIAAKTPVDVEWLRGLINSEIYKTLVLPYFYQYPPRSLMEPIERALLYCLVRALKPENVVEIGTYFAGTTEVLARAVWENGVGCVYSVDPYGAGRVSQATAAWPEPLRAITIFSSDNSMSFLTQLLQAATPVDFVLVTAPTILNSYASIWKCAPACYGLAASSSSTTPSKPVDSARPNRSLPTIRNGANSASASPRSNSQVRSTISAARCREQAC